MHMIIQIHANAANVYIYTPSDYELDFSSQKVDWVDGSWQSGYEEDGITRQTHEV